MFVHLSVEIGMKMKLNVILFSLVLNGVLSIPIDVNPPRWSILESDFGRLQIADFNPFFVDPVPFFNPTTDVQFLLYTRRNRAEPQKLKDVNTVRSSNWNGNNGVRIIIHGHNSDKNAPLNLLTRNEYLRIADYNVIVVDWSAGSNTRVFGSARNRVGVTGGTISLFLDSLHRAGLIKFENIVMIGHNLGAHVAGNAGKQVTRGKIAAIYGLDASGSNFQLSDADRLKQNDAVYTENIHTNGGSNGFLEPITRAAFYPNWGSSQPGCGLDVLGNCAHDRAIQYFIESLGTNRFRARQCAGFQQISTRHCPGIGFGMMGGDGVKTLNGVFFLNVNSVPPFGQN